MLEDQAEKKETEINIVEVAHNVEDAVCSEGSETFDGTESIGITDSTEEEVSKESRSENVAPSNLVSPASNHATRSLIKDAVRRMSKSDPAKTAFGFIGAIAGVFLYRWISSVTSLLFSSSTFLLFTAFCLAFVLFFKFEKLSGRNPTGYNLLLFVAMLIMFLIAWITMTVLFGFFGIPTGL